MFFNFNVYRGRRMFNLNFAAHHKREALKLAQEYIPNFMQLRWVLWSCRGGQADWKRTGENHPAKRKASI